MLRRTQIEVLDDDPLLFEAPPEWLISDTKLSKTDPEDEELGLFSLIERPELISRSWLVRERRRGGQAKVRRRRALHSRAPDEHARSTKAA